MQTKVSAFIVNSVVRNGIDIAVEVEWIWKDSVASVNQVWWDNDQNFTPSEVQTIEREIEKMTDWMAGSVTRPEQDWDDIGD
jgi:hypothetical protein